MKHRTLIGASAAAIAAIAATLPTQSRTERDRADREPIARQRAPLVHHWTMHTDGNPNRAYLGVSTGQSGIRDTLGLLVTSITPGGPAEKAGIEEGNRLAAINGVSLRLSRADAEDPEIPGLMSRRLVRELSKVKPGDEVILSIYAGGRFRDLRVRTGEVPERESSVRRTRADLEDRAVLGLSVSSTGTRRDTLGLFVMRVAPDGPAEKAGIVEGDRIAAINGVDVRVAREDAGDRWIAGAKASRFTRELRKLKAGDPAELRVVNGGATRTVRVNTVRAGDLRADGLRIFPGDGFEFVSPPAPPLPPRIHMAPGAAPAPLPFRSQFHTLEEEDFAVFEHLGESLGHLGEIIGDVIGGIVPAMIDGVVIPIVEGVIPDVMHEVLPAIEAVGPAIERAVEDAVGRAPRGRPVEARQSGKGKVLVTT